LEVPIISYEPIIQQESKLVPKKVCKEVNQPTHQIQQRGGTPQYQNNNLGGMILGGLVGSMIGQNESQRRIGGVVGAIVGNRVVNSRNNQQLYNQHPSVNHVTHCYSSWSNEVIDVVKEYRVVYKLNGMSYTTTNYKPTSNFIKINKKIVVDGVIDNSHNQIYTPTEIVPQLNNNGVEIIEDKDYKEEYIQPYKNSG